MKDDPLWIDVTELMKKGTAGLGEFVTRLAAQPDASRTKVGKYVGRLSRLLGITDVDLHIEEVTGADKSLDVVVDIFNRVNSGGTEALEGRPGAGQDLRRVARRPRRHEGQAQGVGQGRTTTSTSTGCCAR